MGRATYYSPMLLGALLVLALNEPLRSAVPAAPPWQQWTLVTGLAAAFAIQCQVLMVGAQGAFAQVLPVPGGRSVRGRSAVLGGWLLVAWFVLSSVTAVLFSGGIQGAAWVVGIAALATLGGFFVTFVWSLPAATRDFAGDGRLS